MIVRRTEFPEPSPVRWLSGNVAEFRHHPKAVGDSRVFKEGSGWALAFWSMMIVPFSVIGFMFIDTRIWTKGPIGIGLLIALLLLIGGWLYRVVRIAARTKTLVIEGSGVVRLAESWPHRQIVEMPISDVGLLISRVTVVGNRGSFWTGVSLIAVLDESWFVLASAKDDPKVLIQYANEVIPEFPSEIEMPTRGIVAKFPK